jgi:hypothetical protein
MSLLQDKQGTQGPCIELDTNWRCLLPVGPEEQLFNKSWTLPDLERVAQ